MLELEVDRGGMSGNEGVEDVADESLSSEDFLFFNDSREGLGGGRSGSEDGKILEPLPGTTDMAGSGLYGPREYRERGMSFCNS